MNMISACLTYFGRMHKYPFHTTELSRAELSCTGLAGYASTIVSGKDDVKGK